MMKNIAVLLFSITLVVANTVTVQVGAGSGLTFSPANINILVGDTVTWVWASSGHNVISGSAGTCSPDGKFSSGGNNAIFNTGNTFSFQFNSAGTFPYYCTPHCAFGMTGSIVVSNPTTPAPTPAPCPVAPTAYDSEFNLFNSDSSFSLASSSASSFLLLSFPNPSIIEFTNVLPGQRLSTPGTIQYSFSTSSVITTSFLFVALAPGNVMSNVANVTLTLN